MSESPVTIPMPRPSPRPASECDPNCTLQTALELIVRIYHRYSSSVNRNDTLNQQELKLFLNREAPTFLEACDRDKPGYIKTLFRDTDMNKDKKLSFEEFTKILAMLTDDAHRISHGDDRCGPDQD
ncbi:protein S100-A7-like [Alligator mississippiensis]|uniref:protein S100-A7-like n=1 Tax=Alligator mississippiensis TaxID=8496 RepID=UPI00287735BC|nr:protein S100-A7-like [Alligator mississippiensis]